MSSIPTLNAANLDPAALGAALRSLGFVALSDHGIDASLTLPAYEAVRKLFALPEPVKRRYVLSGSAGARGYTPYRVEKAKDQSLPDLKEFWHVGREPEPGGSPPHALAKNVWPDEVPELKPALTALYRELDRLGREVLSAVALHLGLPARWFDPHVAYGDSILRPLHYPPLELARGSSGLRSAPHEDINLITLMIASGEPGLEILTRAGAWQPVETTRGEVIVNVGDMLQRLTNHVLPSTTHRVVNPPAGEDHQARYSLPFFLHPNADFLIETLPTCIGEHALDRYPRPITAGAYLRERLREIGLA